MAYNRRELLSTGLAITAAGSMAGCLSRSDPTVDYLIRVYTEVDQQQSYSLHIRDSEENELLQSHRGELTRAGDANEYLFQLEEGYYEIRIVLMSDYVNSHYIELFDCEESDEQEADVAIWDDYSVTFRATQCFRSPSTFG